MATILNGGTNMKRRRITITAFHRRTTVVLGNLPERSRSKPPCHLEASQLHDTPDPVRNSKTQKRRDDHENTDENSDDNLSCLIDV